MSTTALVPAYNEQDTIGLTVGELRSIEGVDRVVVVDDASGDRTVAVALEAGADLILNGSNLGKGGSLNRALSGLAFDTLLIVDGDLGRHATEADKLLAAVLSGEADLSIAAFPRPAVKGGFGLVQGLARLGIRALTGLEMLSPVSGQRAMTRSTFEAVYPFREGFGVEVAMTIDAHRAGCVIREVPTGMGHRETGRNLAGFIHRGRQFFDIAGALVSRASSKRRPRTACGRPRWRRSCR